MEYGQVQRGLLGIQIADVTAEIAESKKLDIVQGVFVSFVNAGSAAEVSGIETGDVIVAINNHSVAGVSEMQEWVARHRPGQSIKVTYRRDGKNYDVKAILKKFDGSNEMKKAEVSRVEGVELEDLSYAKLTELNLDGGVLIKKVSEGKWKKSGLKENFIITHIDKVPVDNAFDFNRIMEMKKGGVLLEGVFKNGERGTFGVEF